MNQNKEAKQLQAALALLRITLGVIILATWFDNLQKDLYTAEGLNGFLSWLFDAQNGNASSLAFYKSFLYSTIMPIAGPFSTIQMIVEFLLGLTLLLGLFTRLAGFIAMFFFVNLFLSYFGGHEWIWVYVLLFMSALTTSLGAAGRRWGLDQWVLKKHGSSPVAIAC